MSRFKRQLERLPAPPGGSAPPGAVPLEQLQTRLEALAQGCPLASPEPPWGSFEALGFEPQPTAQGPVLVRRWCLPSDHLVGRAPTSAARSASAGLLALLALDPSLAGGELGRALYLDTETTGLGGAGSLAFLVGLAAFDAEGALWLEQLLLRSPSDEAALLDWLTRRVEHASCLVSFNGRSFDWPLLVSRYVMVRRPAPPAPPHLDLLHVARRLHRGRLGRCSLKRIEVEVLGFQRGQDIEGAEVASRYAHFLRTGDVQELAPVIEHNAWDVLSMAALVGLYGEPLERLEGGDLVGLARTLRRAGALTEASLAAERAVVHGGGAAALRARGDIAKARGERSRALEDYEALAREVSEPSLRLELAKLYEHHVKRPWSALEQVERGTSETPERQARRRSRLQSKLRRQGR